MVKKPSEKEEEYFKRLQLEKNKQKQQAEEQQQQALKQQLHNLECPHCHCALTDRSDQTLKMASCQTCQGLWLTGDSVRGLLAAEQNSFWQQLKGVLKK